MRIIISIAFILTVGGCTEKRTGDWRQKYISQERSRIVTIEKSYEFVSGKYLLKHIDSTLETFNEHGQKLGTNDLHFFKYDTYGKLIAEEYCMRTCENAGKEIYLYDSLDRLEKTVVTVSKESEWVSVRFYYNDKNLLIKKIIGNDSTPTTETLTYDNLNRKKTITKREFNSNVNKWLTFVDSIFYDKRNNIVLKKSHQIGKDFLGISKYYYQDTLLITQIDTAITTIPGYLLTPETIHHVYFFRIDFKYNDDNQLIEKITTRPDYKTPVFRMTYEYR